LTRYNQNRFITQHLGRKNVAEDYEAEILSWRQMMDDKLRAEDSWLTLTGLYWLNEGNNSLGSGDACDILLPQSAPTLLGSIIFHLGMAELQVTADVEVTVDAVPTQTAVLRNDHDPLGASRVAIGAVSFNVIKRENQYGIRVRDNASPDRQNFPGRIWLPIDPSYKVTASFERHPEPRILQIDSSSGILLPTENPGWAQFELDGQPIHLEAFSSKSEEVWFAFRDATSKTETYPAGRFLYAPLQADGTVLIDFNKAYSPPCAFTPYAMCPLPPKENVLSLRIPVGEKAPLGH
jgi:uncharacterized protein